MSADPASGTQYEIRDEQSSVVVTEVGATLRSYMANGSPVLFGFAATQMASYGRGQVLFPWPNRLGDGRYSFAGIEANAAIDEPSTGCAIHGLVRWAAFELVDKTPGSLTLATTLQPQPGYPFRVRLELTYGLLEGGLLIRSTVTNLWHADAPFGLGFHPYLKGAGTIDTGWVELPARTHVIIGERGLPRGLEPVESITRSGLVFCRKDRQSATSTLSGTVIDDCFTGLELDANGRWHARFYPQRDASPITVWGEAAFSHLMCFTGDTLAPKDRRRGIAIEPMTCAPNALQSGDGVLVVEPGRSFTSAFGIIP